MLTRLTPLALAGLTLVLTACVGGDDDDSPANARGTPIGSPVQVSSLNTAQLDAAPPPLAWPRWWAMRSAT